jgi:hypothetical protein
MKKIFLGSNPQTSLAGIILAGLYALQAATSTTPAHWYDVAIPVAIAILGRVAGDSSNSN